MTIKQSAFRDAYRLKIEGWYSPAAHVVLIYAIGIGALSFFLSRITHPIAWYQWAVIPLVALVSNILEWAMHRYVMHRPHNNMIARAIYKRHTQMHHQFFTEKNCKIDAIRDFRIVFFPPYTEIAALALAAPGSLLIGLLFGANAGWLSISTVACLYMVYELFHLCCHVSDNWFVRTMPFINTIRRHHVAHHEHAIMMDRNMNLTFPIADWLFRTSDLNRGLLGTLFNGYSNKFVKKDIERKLRRPGFKTAANESAAFASGKIAVYAGDRTIEGNIVTRDKVKLDPRLDLVRYADALDWGSDSPAARQLAFALLVDHLGDPERAVVMVPAFAHAMVQQFDNEWELTSTELGNAIAAVHPEP
jgi:hypothetical protein